MKIGWDSGSKTRHANMRPSIDTPGYIAKLWSLRAVLVHHERRRRATVERWQRQQVERGEQQVEREQHAQRSRARQNANPFEVAVVTSDMRVSRAHEDMGEQARMDRQGRLLKAARIHAARHGITLRALIEQALRDRLAQGESMR